MTGVSKALVLEIIAEYFLLGNLVLDVLANEYTVYEDSPHDIETKRIWFFSET